MAEPILFVSIDGSREFRLNSRLHNTEGPAVIRSNGSMEWWIHGIQIDRDVAAWMDENDIKWPFDEQDITLLLMRWS